MADLNSISPILLHRGPRVTRNYNIVSGSHDRAQLLLQNTCRWMRAVLPITLQWFCLLWCDASGSGSSSFSFAH